MNLSEKELKKAILEVLAEEQKSTGLGAAGLLGGLPDMNNTAPNEVVNLFLTAFGLAQPQDQQQGQQQGGAPGDSWRGLSWREVMQALKAEFGISGAQDKNWYKKLPFNHPARVKYREYYNNR